MADESRIERELAGDEYSYKSRIEQFIAWLNEDIPTHPEPKSRIEEQLAAMTPGGGGSATLIEKSINQNGTYKASDDNADGYSKVSVNVDIPQNSYFGIPVAKTAADAKHLVYETFSTVDYASKTILAVTMEAAANDNRFDIDSYTVDSSSGGVPTGVTLNYGTTQPKVYAYDSDYAAMKLNNISDYARIRKTEPYETAYLISSKAMLITTPLYDYGVTTYSVFALGRDIINNSKSAWWNYQYRYDLSTYLEMRGYKVGSESAYQEPRARVPEIGSYVSLSPLRKIENTPTTFIDGLFKVDFGPVGLNGFYEIGGQLFYISAGIAIKDE